MKIRGTIKVEPTSPNVAVKIGSVWGIEPEILHYAGQYMWVIIFDDDEALGLVAAFPFHPFKAVGIVVEHFRWNPKLSPRRRVEAAYAFGSHIGSRMRMIGYSRKHDFKFFKKMQKLGVLRKVGMQSTGFGQMVTVWETPQKLLDQKPH
jgi:hypothetical protein